MIDQLVYFTCSAEQHKLCHKIYSQKAFEVNVASFYKGFNVKAIKLVSVCNHDMTVF